MSLQTPLVRLKTPHKILFSERAIISLVIRSGCFQFFAIIHYDKVNIFIQFFLHFKISLWNIISEVELLNQSSSEYEDWWRFDLYHSCNAWLCLFYPLLVAWGKGLRFLSTPALPAIHLTHLQHVEGINISAPLKPIHNTYYKWIWNI